MSERFECEHNWIIDNNKRNTKESLIVYDEEWNTLDDLCELLNQLQQRIAELEEQLANTIRPKYKIGQTSYHIFNGIVGIFKPEKVCEVRDLLILGIQFYGQEIQYQTTYGLFSEKDLFITKEEALKKLEEMKGEIK